MRPISAESRDKGTVHGAQAGFGRLSEPERDSHQKVRCTLTVTVTDQSAARFRQRLQYQQMGGPLAPDERHLKTASAWVDERKYLALHCEKRRDCEQEERRGKMK